MLLRHSVMESDVNNAGSLASRNPAIVTASHARMSKTRHVFAELIKKKQVTC